MSDVVSFHGYLVDRPRVEDIEYYLEKDIGLQEAIAISHLECGEKYIAEILGVRRRDVPIILERGFEQMHEWVEKNPDRVYHIDPSEGWVDPGPESLYRIMQERRLSHRVKQAFKNVASPSTKSL